jgi:hypothetical protein
MYLNMYLLPLSGVACVGVSGQPIHASAGVVMSPAHRNLLTLQVASVQQSKGRCRAAE